MKKVILISVVILLLISGIFFLNTNRKTATPALKKKENLGPVIPPKTLTQIKLTTNGFDPSTLTVKVNDTVNWKNESEKDATVSSDPHPTHELYPFLNLGIFKTGSSVQATFPKAGKFTYHNHLIPSQKGTIIVE